MDFDENLGKVYTLSLYDGDSKGLVEISMDGMDLVCYKLSKAYFQKYKDDQDLKNKKSVYFLYGGGCFYVGQAGIRRDGTAITSRINEHLKNPEKDFLEEIVFFCQDKNEWDSGTLDYIEASLIEMFEIRGYRFAHPQNHETKDKYLSKTKIHKFNTYMKDIERIIALLGYDEIRKIQNFDGSIYNDETSQTEQEQPDTCIIGKFPKGAEIPIIKDDSSSTTGTLLFNGLSVLASAGFEFSDDYYTNCLLNHEWCKSTFGVSKFILDNNEDLNEDDFYNSPNDKKKKRKRYNMTALHFGKHSFYVTAQVYESNRPRILRWFEQVLSESKN